MFSTAITPATLTVTEALERTHDRGAAVAERPPLIDLQALDAGSWGNRLRVAIEDEPAGLVSRTTLRRVLPPNRLELASAAGAEAGTVLELIDPAGDRVVGPPLKVVSLDRASSQLTLAGPLTPDQLQSAANAVAQGRPLWAGSREFRLRVALLRQPDPAVPSRNEQELTFEVFRHLSMDPRHSRYVERVIGSSDPNAPKRRWDRRSEGESWYLRARDRATSQSVREGIRLGPETLIDQLPNGTLRPAQRALQDGDDAIATLTDDHYVGQDAAEPEDRSGLYSLTAIDVISMVACPGRASPRIQQALISHCELDRYRFAVLDSVGPPNDTITDVQAQRQQFDTRYAALYYPWLLVAEPFPANLAQVAEDPIPPSGHMLGIYARTDVHRAPANTNVRGPVLRLSRTLHKREHDLLNPSPVNVNVIRDFRPDNRGIRVWGARVITTDPDWRYVNVRRLLIYHREVDRRRPAMGGVRAQRRAAVGAGATHDRQLPHHRVAQRRSGGNQAGGGVFRQVRPHHHDPDRHRQRPADLPGRRGPGQAGRVRDHPDRTVDRERRGIGGEDDDRW